MKDLKKYTDKLYNDLQEDLELYAEMGIIPMNKLTGAMQSIRDAVQKLKAYIIEHPFETEADEIEFFKTIKPKFVSEQVFLIDQAMVLMHRPPLTDPMLADYFQAELNKVHEYLGEHRYWYQYYLMDAAELDTKLFVGGAGPMDSLLPVLTDPGPEFSTNGDFLWAKFIALDRLKTWLDEEIGGLRGSDGGGNDPDGGKGPVIKWTGETINLVEIAYGIWLTGQLNNGNVSITQVVEWLERHFGVKIGKAHRRWQGIAGRKRLRYTRYLDECKAAIEKRVEEEAGR